jgi:hypothetical protein
MSDNPNDQLLSHAFAQVEEAVMPRIRLTGAAAARVTVRRRRRNRLAVTAAAAAVVLLLVPVAALTLHRSSGGPPVVSSSTAPSAPATSPTPTGPQMGIRGDSRPPSELDDALLTLPSFHQANCPSGPTQFHGGQWSGQPVFDTFVPRVTLVSVASGDVNADGVADQVALLTCNAGTDPTGVADQVVATTGDGPGRYRTIGQVTYVAGGLSHLHAPAVDDQGVVQVFVATTPTASTPTSLQRRSYRWTGKAFTALSAPPAVPWSDRSTELSVAVTPIRITGAGRTATVAITVTNAGGASSLAIDLVLDTQVPLALISIAPPRSLTRGVEAADPPRYDWSIRIDPVPAAGTATGTFEVHLDGALPTGAATLNVWAVGLTDGDLSQENADPTNMRSIPISIG